MSADNNSSKQSLSTHHPSTKEKMDWLLWLRLLLGIGLFVLITAVQFSGAVPNIQGVLAQLQVMVSVFLVLNLARKGYITALVLNAIISLMTAIRLLTTGDMVIIPGVIVPIGTITIISIIHYFARRLKVKMKEVVDEREEISALYEEVYAAQDEMSRQNKQLGEYNILLQQNEAKLHRLAFFDALTDLPNRKMIINKINESCKTSIPFVVVFMDLDNFKKVNDTLGHHVGDKLLKHVGFKLKALVNKRDLVGRLGGDEFAILVAGELPIEELIAYLDSVRIGLLDVFTAEAAEFNMSASFGISLYPRDGDTSHDLLKAADMAMYQAKESGRNQIFLYDHIMREKQLVRKRFEGELLSCVVNKEVYTAFFPQYYTHSKVLRGFEVLARWNSTLYGIVNPMEFIPVAEETGFIHTLGEWIFDDACTKWRQVETDNELFYLSFNISVAQLMEQSFVPMVKRVIEKTGISPHTLEFEVTESLIASFSTIEKVLQQIREIGIRIALDGMGSVGTAFGYMMKLPIDTVKIDKSIIWNIDAGNPQYAGAIIQMAHQLGKEVIGKGVETESQLAYLEAQKCDALEGFLLGKALSENEMNALMLKVQKNKQTSNP